ncbi:hypothetical protein V1478_011215 [Vespula squamosa]|uniref:Uncharacterized protein n=1 Tax=Vespula squamosa TaxID=30214 RepID=A0ABD2ADV2_VESSQ
MNHTHTLFPLYYTFISSKVGIVKYAVILSFLSYIICSYGVSSNNTARTTVNIILETFII